MSVVATGPGMTLLHVLPSPDFGGTEIATRASSMPRHRSVYEGICCCSGPAESHFRYFADAGILAKARRTDPAPRQRSNPRSRCLPRPTPGPARRLRSPRQCVGPANDRARLEQLCRYLRRPRSLRNASASAATGASSSDAAFRNLLSPLDSVRYHSRVVAGPRNVPDPAAREDGGALRTGTGG